MRFSLLLQVFELFYQESCITEFVPELSAQQRAAMFQVSYQESLLYQKLCDHCARNCMQLCIATSFHFSWKLQLFCKNVGRGMFSNEPRLDNYMKDYSELGLILIEMTVTSIVFAKRRVLPTFSEFNFMPLKCMNIWDFKYIHHVRI